MKLDNILKERVIKIMNLALIKSEKTKNTIFLSFTGHVEWLEISIYKNGWENSTKVFFKKRIRFYKKNVFEELDETIKKLEELD
nr:hypothetical protein [uncultured Leptotrichia sp.]